MISLDVAPAPWNIIRHNNILTSITELIANIDGIIVILSSEAQDEFTVFCKKRDLLIRKMSL